MRVWYHTFNSASRTHQFKHSRLTTSCVGCGGYVVMFILSRVHFRFSNSWDALYIRARIAALRPASFMAPTVVVNTYIYMRSCWRRYAHYCCCHISSKHSNRAVHQQPIGILVQQHTYCCNTWYPIPAYLLCNRAESQKLRKSPVEGYSSALIPTTRYQGTGILLYLSLIHI